MSIGNEGEEKIPTDSELAALARKRDRQDKLAGKERGRAKQARGKRSEVSEKDLLAKWGGKKVRRVVFDRRQAFRQLTENELQRPPTKVEIIFGSEDETQLVFRRAKGRLKKGPARWTVSLVPVTLCVLDTEHELSKHGRGLWNKEKGEPVLAVKAVEQLRACHDEIERLRRLHSLRLRLRQCLLWRLREKAKKEGVIEPDAALYTYPKPLVDTLRELREQQARVEEQRDTQIVSLIMARDAILLTFKALSEELGGKMQIAFDSLPWPQELTKLQWAALDLARDLQRPPTKAELKKSYDPDERMDPAQFSRLLKSAGLKWLPGAKSPRKLS